MKIKTKAKLLCILFTVCFTLKSYNCTATSEKISSFVSGIRTPQFVSPIELQEQCRIIQTGNQRLIINLRNGISSGNIVLQIESTDTAELCRAITAGGVYYSLTGELDIINRVHQYIQDHLAFIDINENTGSLLRTAILCGESCHNLIQFLLENCHAEVNIQDETGFTPLHYAVQSLDTHVVNLLLYYGAHYNVRDNDGQTPRGVIDTIIRTLRWPDGTLFNQPYTQKILDMVDFLNSRGIVR